MKVIFTALFLVIKDGFVNSLRGQDGRATSHQEGGPATNQHATQLVTGPQEHHTNARLKYPVRKIADPKDAVQRRQGEDEHVTHDGGWHVGVERRQSSSPSK